MVLGERASGDLIYLSPMQTSNPTVKILQVLEFFSVYSEDAFTLNDLSIQIDISKPTLLRILNTLVQHGYLVQNKERKYVGNFTLSHTIALSDSQFASVKKALQQLAIDSGRTVEMLTVKKESLYWHEQIRVPERNNPIFAHPGMFRVLYQLDAPARVYLKHLCTDYVEKNFLTTKFFTHKGSNRIKHTWGEARKILDSVKLERVEYDTEGNDLDIRRYALMLKEPDGRFLFILSVAEMVTRQNDTRLHIQEICELMTKTRDKLLRSLFR